MSTYTFPNLARAVICVADHFLLCRNPQASESYLYLPGGHIEKGESAKEALQRELKEETSLDFSIGQFLGVFEYQFFPKDPHLIKHTQEYNFLFEAHCPDCHPTKDVPEPEKDSVQFQWVHKNALSTHTIYPETLHKFLPNIKQHAEKNDYFFSKMK